MIKKWDSQFHGGSHGHLVGLEKKILRQPDLGIDIKHPIQIRRLLDSFEIRLEYVTEFPLGLLEPFWPH